MEWGEELRNSAVWLAQAYVICALAFGLGVVALARWTVWGRQFRAITGDYFLPRRSWRPLAVVALMLFLSLAAVRLNVLFSYWFNGMYSGLQALDAKVFWFHVSLFAVLATVHVLRSLFNAYVRTALSIHWRAWLNERLVSDWMASRAYYLARFAQPEVDNPEQRIQQDADTLTVTTISLSMGLVEAMVSIVSFTIILWGLSGPLSLLGMEIPRAMVFLVYAYVLVATVFAIWIGRPLIALNFLEEKFSASYRYLLMRVREYGESVALYRGEAVEQTSLQRSFADVIANAWARLWRTLKFDGYNFGVSQVSVLFPLLVQGPRVLGGSIKLGDLMQTMQAFNQVQDALSFFRETYDRFAGYRAVLDRLSGFRNNLEAAATLPLPVIASREQGLQLRGLSVRRPDGGLLVADLSLDLQAGESVLIRGPSGAGKTTLLRAMAGLWPFTEGELARPLAAQSLFLSQKPYLPIGSLRAALAYPGTDLSVERAQEVLEQVHLAHLAPQLEREQDWSQVLSPGEQQRLAFGRALVNAPALLFLDEATAATDAGLEHALHARLRESLPQTTLVSVGHRESLLAFHARCLDLDGQGRWRMHDSRP